MFKIVFGATLALGLWGTASAAVDCGSFPNNTINLFVNDDVVAVNTSCTIGASGSVNGNVIQSGEGGLVIRGIVNGGVTESGPGDILVARGTVGGDVSESDGGNVSIRGGSNLQGVIEESGDGSVNITVDVPGLVKGDVYENGNGGVTVISSSGSYEGNVVETGAGSVSVNVSFGLSFKGDIEENDGGSVTAVVNGMFEGGIVEVGAGNVVTSGPGTFKGNSEHQLPGLCSNTIIDFQGSACILN